MKRFALTALAIVVAVVPASAAHLTISGYIDVGYFDIESDRANNGANFASGNTNGGGGAGPGAGANSQFSLNEINLDFRTELTDNLLAAMSLDSIRGGALAPDWAFIEWSNPGSFDLNVRMGLVPSSIGIEQRWAESNQTKFVSLSLLSPWTVGASEGLQAYGTWSPINWQLAVTNTDAFGDGASIVPAGSLGANAAAGTAAFTASQIGNRPNNNGGALPLNGNENLNISGRLGVLPIEGLELGISGSMGQQTAATAVTGGPQGDRSVLGVDGQYRYGPFTVMGEYITVEEEQNTGVAAIVRDAEMDAFYIGATYDFTDQITFGARYGDVDQDGVTAAGSFPALEYSQISLLGAYDLAENVIVKVQYDINDVDTVRGTAGGADLIQTTGGGNIDNDAIAVSVVASF